MQENAPKQKTKAELEAEIAKNQEGIEAAQVEFNGEEEGRLEKQNAELKKQLESLSENLPSAEINPAEISQVENMGGEKEKLNEMTAGVDEKIAGKDERIKSLEIQTSEKVEHANEGAADGETAEKFFENTKESYNQSFNTAVEDSTRALKFNIKKQLEGNNINDSSQYESMEGCIGSLLRLQTQVEHNIKYDGDPDYISRYTGEKKKEFLIDLNKKIKQKIDELKKDYEGAIKKQDVFNVKK